jgi:hypothetical protein
VHYNHQRQRLLAVVLRRHVQYIAPRPPAHLDLPVLIPSHSAARTYLRQRGANARSEEEESK